MKSLVYKAYLAAIIFLIVGGMAWGWMAATGKNIVSKFFGSWAGIVYGLVGISAVFMLMWGRDVFLPFLGPAVFPCAVLQDKIPERADTTVSVSVRPGAKVLYWAAEPASEGLKDIQSWREAYGSLENAGIATANSDGVAILQFRKPQPYTVAIHGMLQTHVHYRECGDNGWLSTVQTHFMEEGFQDAETTETTDTIETTDTSQKMPQPIEEPVYVPLQEPEIVETSVESNMTETQSPEFPTSETDETNETTIPFRPMEDSSPVEGFSNEPFLAAIDSVGTTLATVQVDPRLEELKRHVQQSSMELIDSNTMGFTEHLAFGGTELDAAFAAPETHPIPPAV